MTYRKNREWARCQRFGAAAIVSLGLVWLVVSAAAQSIQPIYSFANGPVNPYAGLTLGPDGNFYGTTSYGGTGNVGTVFKITTNGTLTVLVSFAGTNGADPHAALILGPDGNFYGTTAGGGSGREGTVFRITTDGALTTLYSFSAPVTYTNGDGTVPNGLTLGPDGNFYGTTSGGGISGDGTTFRITTTGTLTTLYSFSAIVLNGTTDWTNVDGAVPRAGLTLGPDGNFYGTTSFAGSGGNGTVFRMATNGELTTLASFGFSNPFSNVRAASPFAGLTLGPDGNFYGTTAGTLNYPGTVFRITTNGVLTILYYLNGSPYSGLTLGPDGNFYGTTYNGNGYGSLYRINTNGVQTNLFSFASTNGAYPYAGLTLGPDGNFYGVTYGGGNSNQGEVFRVTTNGVLTGLANFTTTNGLNPDAGLTLGPDGNLYGTTVNGGIGGGRPIPTTDGTIFRITTNGALTTLLLFAYTNGALPDAGLTLGPDGNFYGTTSEGGSSIDGGTAFRMTIAGTLTSFDLTNGFFSQAGLTLGPDGNFYGTTLLGGSNNSGTVFQMTINGTLTTLHSFSKAVNEGGAVFTNADGADPSTGLTLGPDGNLYGTTSQCGSNGFGTLFRIAVNGTLTTLYSFSETVNDGSANFTNADGASPDGGLTLGPDDNLYGTTPSGGSGGEGTVFQLTTSGTLTTLHSFSATVNNGNGTETNNDGASPQHAGLTVGPDGNLYGTTAYGGSSGDGTVFQITTDGTMTTLGNFDNENGATPYAGVTLGPDGNFYGTTYGGGSGSGGVIYRLDLPPSIITQPSNQIVFAGSNVTFNVTLFGTAPFGYQWLYNSTPIVGATNSSLTVPDAMPSAAGDYQVIVTNAWGSVTSAVATLSVITVPPIITNQPVNQSVPIGGTATFSVGATGTPPLAYQWYFNRRRGVQRQEPLPGATNIILSFGPVHPNQDGNYQVIVTSPYGSATSDVASLTVLLRPNFYGITNHGQDSVTLLLAGTPGSTNRLWATTNLNLPFTQWQPITTNTAGATGLFQFTDTNTGNAPAKFYILSSP